jgi:hypothetical protein
MRTAKFPGYYGAGKIDDAMQEAIDFVATEMFLADEGWLNKIMHLDTEADMITLPLPISAAMIKEVRYKIGETYIPIDYDEGIERPQASDDSGTRQSITRYRIVDNAFFFNPPLIEGGTGYLQLEYMAFPKRLQDDSDFIEPQFNAAMYHFIKYRTATILAASIEKYVIPWTGLESSWYEKMALMVNKRNMQSKRIREYEGGA